MEGGQYKKKKITWVINNVSSLKDKEKVKCLPFVVDECIWHILAEGYDNYLLLYLQVTDFFSLPDKWKREAEVSVTIVNQIWTELSRRQDSHHTFDQRQFVCGFGPIITLDKLCAQNGGFVINGELHVTLEIEVLETTIKSDSFQSTLLETVEVHGFELPLSQAKYVSLILKTHPDFVSEFQPTNPNLKRGYISLLISLMEVICESSISEEHLSEAESVIEILAEAGFKLDWLQRKLHQISERMKNQENLGTMFKQMNVAGKEMKKQIKKWERSYMDAKAKLLMEDVAK